MGITETSKFLSLILRHKPETIGISLDEHGWADVSELIEGISKTCEFNMDILEEIVRTDEKQRYSFNEDKTLIRANQGHSIPVDVELEKIEPPKYLFHGTGVKYKASIDKEGLIPKSRLYVHLSADIETAEKVGRRHGKSFIYRVNSREMENAGYEFFRSANGVWLTKKVPSEYLSEEPSVEVRYKKSSDDPMTISDVYEQSWKYAYKDIIPQNYLDSIPKGKWASSIEKMDNLVAGADGKIIGTLGFSESRWENYPGFGEIVSIYLLPEYIGKGYGKLLLDMAEKELKNKGFEKLLLWVLEENWNARKFYERNEFDLSSEVRDDNIGGRDLREVLYIKNLKK